MAGPQKSTIVRIRNGRTPGAVPRRRPGRPRVGRTDRPRPVVRGPAAMAAVASCRPAASRSRSSRSGPSCAATSGATGRRSTWCTAGAAAARSSRRSSSPGRGGFRVVMFDAPAHGDSEPGPAGPGRTTAWSSGRRWTPCSRGTGRPRRSSHTRSAQSRRYLTLRFGWLSTRRLVLSAPMVAAEPLFDQFQRALGFGARTRRAFDRHLEAFVGIPMAEFDARFQAAASTRCPRSWCTTAVTARRRGPTRPGSSSRCPTPASSTTDGLGHRRILRDRRWSGRWWRSCDGAARSAKAQHLRRAVSLPPFRRLERCQAHR